MNSCCETMYCTTERDKTMLRSTTQERKLEIWHRQTRRHFHHLWWMYNDINAYILPKHCFAKFKLSEFFKFKIANFDFLVESIRSAIHKNYFQIFQYMANTATIPTEHGFWTTAGCCQDWIFTYRDPHHSAMPRSAWTRVVCRDPHFVCALPPIICIYLLCRDEHLFGVWARSNRCNVTVARNSYVLWV